jgi:hypothetical protein
MQQNNTIIDILTMEKGSFPWWPSWFFCVELSPFIYFSVGRNDHKGHAHVTFHITPT